MKCTIYLDYHKWVLQNLDDVLYGCGIAPFIWTIINGCFKILDETSASLWISFSGLDENLWNFTENLRFIGTYKEHFCYNHFHTFIMFIFCMYLHIFMSIFHV